MSVREINLPWMVTAENNLNLKEIPGSRSNPIIMSWAEELGGWIMDFYENDDIPWCGLFVAHCMKDNNIDITIKNPLSARAWAKFGEKVNPSFGAIMVFSRKGGGHVGFYVSEDRYYYHILGGNQSNSVNVTRVSKKRFLTARFPSDYIHLCDNQKILKEFDGKISTNEE